MSNTTKRNRRQNKKLHLGEFAVLGFSFSCKPEADFNSVFDSLISLMDERGLQIWAEGTPDSFDAYITSSQRYGSASDEDRSAVEACLSAQSGLKDIKVDALSDAYYG